jgi:hypothetical protein
VRPLFDQYTQPENRLTHALACALHHDRAILRSFLRWIGAEAVPPPDRLRVVEQRLPGEEIEGVEITEAESERRGLPDICIYDDNEERPWALAIESKAQAKAYADQLRRHQTTLTKRGFPKPQLLLITVEPAPPAEQLPDRVVARQWRQIYAWLREEHADSFWSRAVTEYMEVFETKMVAQEYSIRGTITMFDGLRFDEDRPYNYPEAKRLLLLLGDELRKDKRMVKLGMDPEGEGRGAITGRARDSVWDFLPLTTARGSTLFTNHPHFTFSIARTHPGALITVPNGVKGGFRKRLESLGENGFLTVLRTIESNLRGVIKASRGASPLVYALQRHFLTQSSGGIEDARLSFDLRTIVPGGQDRVKYQPEWAIGMYQALTQKRSNIQMGVGVHFSYRCPIVRSPMVTDLFVNTWFALEPVLSVAAPHDD